jgi:hypothetical protein
MHYAGDRYEVVAVCHEFEAFALTICLRSALVGNDFDMRVSLQAHEQNPSSNPGRGNIGLNGRSPTTRRLARLATGERDLQPCLGR